MEEFNRKLALATSYALHPLFMPSYGMLLAFFYGNIPQFNPYATESDLYLAYQVLGIVFVATGIFPVIVAFILKKMGMVSSLHMPKKEERVYPFVLTGGAYLGAIYLITDFLSIPIDPKIYLFMMMATLSILLGLIITVQWKISVHMIGIGGVTGIITVLSKFNDEKLISLLIICILAAGLIGFGRLNLKAHTIKQVLAGFLLGFGCEVFPLILIG